MSKLSIFVSATIVLIFTGHTIWAAPTGEVPQPIPVEEEWPEAKLDENLTISEAPEVKGKSKPSNVRYYPYRQALTFRGGIASDFPKMNFNDTALGFQYLFPKFLSPKLEAGADLHEENRGHIHVGARWFAWERDYFRPSGKLSLDHLAESEENLATLTRIDNYYLRISGTLEYVVWNPFSVRLEQELLLGFKDCWTVITLGISRGW